MQANPFWPKSPTIMGNITTATGNVALTPTTSANWDCYRLVSISTGPTIFIAMGQSTATATLPLSSAASTAAFGFPLMQNQELIIQGPPNCWFSGITTAATMAAVLAITAGVGKK